MTDILIYGICRRHQIEENYMIHKLYRKNRIHSRSGIPVFISSKKLFSFSRHSNFWLVTKFRPISYFLVKSIKGDRVERKNWGDIFLWIFNNSLKIAKLRKGFLDALVALVIQWKIKGHRTSFWCTFSARLFQENILYVTFYQSTYFQYQASFISWDIQ